MVAYCKRTKSPTANAGECIISLYINTLKMIECFAVCYSMTLRRKPLRPLHSRITPIVFHR